MLDLGSSGGDFAPWVKYNAKAGRWYIGGENGDVEVDKPTFIADFDNIQTGWFYFAAGQAPERIMDPSLTQRAEKPERTYTDQNGKERDCFRRGFSLHMFSDKSFGGVVELTSTSLAMSGPINELYAQYSEEKAANDGKLPVVEFVKADPVVGKHGTNYAPVFKIAKWVKRPDAFDDVTTDSGNSEPVQEAAPATNEDTGSEF